MKKLFDWFKRVNLEWDVFIKREVTGGYVFNKRVLSWTLIVMFLFTGLVFAFNPQDVFETKIYLECNDKLGCLNPFYKDNYLTPEIYEAECPDRVLCEIPFFVYGSSYGVPPNFWYKWSSSILVGILIVGLLLNHFLFNRDFKFEKQVEDYK